MKKAFHKIHIYVSLFFIPIALAYAITGISIIFGIDEDSGMKQKDYQITLDEPLQNDAENSAQGDLMLTFLKENNLKIPSNTSLKNAKGGGKMMGGINYSVILKQNDELNYTLTTRKRSIFGNMILLHKAKGEFYFNILGAAFGLALITLYLSGLIITQFCKNRRKNALIAVILGIFAYVFLGYLSV